MIRHRETLALSDTVVARSSETAVIERVTGALQPCRRRPRRDVEILLAWEMQP